MILHLVVPTKRYAIGGVLSLQRIAWITGRCARPRSILAMAMLNTQPVRKIIDAAYAPVMPFRQAPT
jgi:hypothetical protein